MNLEKSDCGNIDFDSWINNNNNNNNNKILRIWIDDNDNKNK